MKGIFVSISISSKMYAKILYYYYLYTFPGSTRTVAWTIPSKRSESNSVNKPWAREWPTNHHSTSQPAACGSTHGKIKWSGKEFLENMIKHHREEAIKRRKKLQPLPHKNTMCTQTIRFRASSRLESCRTGFIIVHYWWPTTNDDDKDGRTAARPAGAH